MKKFTLWLLFAFVALVANAGNFSVYLKIDGTNVLETSTVKVHIWNSDKDTNTTWGDNGSSLPQVTNIITDVDGAKYFKYPLTDSDNKYNFLFICDGKQSHDYYDATTDIVITYNGKTSNGKYEYDKSTTAPVEPASVYLKGANYNNWADGPKLEYNPEDKTYVYTETNPANLASKFKILIDGKWYRYENSEDFDLLDNKKNNTRTYEEIKEIGDKDMTIKDAANFSSITIKVKKDGDVWKMQVEGTKESTEDLISARWRGLSYNNWTNNNFTKKADGSFTYVVESPAGLADEWGVDITENNGSTWTWYRLPDDKYPKVGTDATLVAESTPNSKQIKITDADKYVTVTLTLKKVEGNWVLSTSGTAKTHTVTMKGAAWGNWESNKFTFTKQDDGTYANTFTGNDIAGLTREFAFTIDGVDYSYLTDLEVNTGEAYTMATGQSNNNYTISTAADYTDITLTVAFSNGTPSLKVTGTKAEKTYPATVTIVGAMTGWAERVFTIDHKGNGIYEGGFDTSTTGGQWRIYEQWDSSKGNSDDNWNNGTSWGYDGDQGGDMISGKFTRNKKGNANTMIQRLWWLIFDINTGDWKLRESTSGVESIDNEGVKIVAGKGTITVSGATNVEVYTAGGALVSREAESHVAAGLYIVRTDNKVAKVIVR